MKKQIFLLLVSAIAYCSCTKSPAQSLCDGETGASPKDIQTQKVTVGDFNAISATSSVDLRMKRPWKSVQARPSCLTSVYKWMPMGHWSLA